MKPKKTFALVYKRQQLLLFTCLFLALPFITHTNTCTHTPAYTFESTVVVNLATQCILNVDKLAHSNASTCDNFINFVAKRNEKSSTHTHVLLHMCACLLNWSDALESWAFANKKIKSYTNTIQQSKNQPLQLTTLLLVFLFFLSLISSNAFHGIWRAVRVIHRYSLRLPTNWFDILSHLPIYSPNSLNITQRKRVVNVTTKESAPTNKRFLNKEKEKIWSTRIIIIYKIISLCTLYPNRLRKTYSKYSKLITLQSSKSSKINANNF